MGNNPSTAKARAARKKLLEERAGGPIPEGHLFCPVCKLVKPVAAFYKQNTARCAARSRSGYCKPCSNKMVSDWGKANRAKVAAHHKEYRDKLRRETITKYGGKCVCCGESNYVFLSLDHVNDDGSLHRKSAEAANIIFWIRKMNYPNTIQVLCYNCNMAKQLTGGRCPHLYDKHCM